MIVPNQKIKVKWCSSNVSWYKEKGYIYTKFGDEFEVDAEDLPLCSHYKIKVVCSYCNQEYETPFVQHIKSEANLGDCCKKCHLLKAAKTCNKKYGVDNPFQSEICKEKSKQTCKDKYGVEFASQSEKVKDKISKTNLERYGYSCAISSPMIKAKAEKTTFDKFGVKNVFELQETQEKIRKTNEEKYGVKYISQVPEICEKIKTTNIERYGVPYTTQVPEVIRKMRESLYKNGNVPTSKNEKMLCDLLKKMYGEDNCFENFALDRINFDCLLIVGENKIDIEYDGWYWHKNNQEHDKRRNYYVLKQGYKVLRFRANNDIPTENQIKEAIDYLVKDNHSIKIVELDI